ncbi:tripartite tricarboxylate transporter substrate binding protein [Acetobacteraceae bacterium H6797]|nr:tripartite tricarboxylate transporter substrate binding protein [Acetobacteraceae bacterium H6797]
MKRRTILAASGLATASLALPALALAQGTTTWPNRPITVLVPFVAGGPSDIVARIMAQRFSEALPQPVVAENRPGANGEVASRLLARAAPDGHTLMVGSIGVFAINAALRPNLGYNPLTDFDPVTLAVSTPNVLVVNAEKMPVKTTAELVAWLKANPGKASYSTSGVGSSDHLTAELFKQMTGTDAVHVPYAGGSAAATDLIAGNVQFSFQNLGTVAAHIAGGRLRALMVTDRQRAEILPDVPTSAEAGLSDFVVTSWQAMMAPAGMPPDIRKKLNDTAVASLRHADSQARLKQIGFTVIASNAEDFRNFQRQEIARWKQVVQAGNIRAE